MGPLSSPISKQCTAVSQASQRKLIALFPAALRTQWTQCQQGRAGLGAIHGLIPLLKCTHTFSVFLWSGMHTSMTSETPFVSRVGMNTPPFSNASLNPPVSITLDTVGCCFLWACPSMRHTSLCVCSSYSTTGLCTVVAIVAINTLPCCGPVCTRCVHCLAQSLSHHGDSISKYWVLSEMRPEENGPPLLYLWQPSPASVAHNGLTAPNTPLPFLETWTTHLQPVMGS